MPNQLPVAHSSHDPTPPSSPPRPLLDGDDEAISKQPGCDKQDSDEADSSSECKQLTAALAPVLDQLESLKSRQDDVRPSDNINIAISSRGLVLLHRLFNFEEPFTDSCDRSSLEPFPSRDSSPPERSAIRQLLRTRPHQVALLESWFCSQRSDFYDDQLVLRMPGEVHFDTTNKIGMYLLHCYMAKFIVMRRLDLIPMLRNGGKNLKFRTRKHEPDFTIWLDGSGSLATPQKDNKKEGQQLGTTTIIGEGGQQPGTNNTAGEEDGTDEIEIGEESKWPGVVLEVGWSHPTPDDVCKSYIINGRGHIRCVLRLNVGYIEPAHESSQELTTAVLDGWRINKAGYSSSPTQFIENIDIFSASPDQPQVSLLLNDLHPSLSADQEVALELATIAKLVRAAYLKGKRGPIPELVEERPAKRLRR